MDTLVGLREASSQLSSLPEQAISTEAREI
jgi:hypothetical protein